MSYHLYYCFYCEFFFINLNKSSKCPNCNTINTKLIYIQEIKLYKENFTNISTLIENASNILKEKTFFFPCNLPLSYDGTCKYPHYPKNNNYKKYYQFLKNELKILGSSPR